MTRWKSDEDSPMRLIQLFFRYNHHHSATFYHLTGIVTAGGTDVRKSEGAEP